MIERAAESDLTDNLTQIAPPLVGDHCPSPDRNLYRSFLRRRRQLALCRRAVKMSENTV